MSIDKRLSFLREKFDSFYSILDATTIPVDDGRRVDGIAHAVALSEATEELYAGIFAAHEYLTQQHGISMPKYPPEIKLQEADSPDGPWENIPPEQVKITRIPIRGVAPLVAALDSASKVVAHSPDSKGNRWHWGDIISTDDLARLDSVNKLLAMPAATDGGVGQEVGDAGKPADERSSPQLTWREAAERLERLRNLGEQFKSQGDYATQFGCSKSTINKAIRETPSLHPWALPEGVSAVSAQSLNDMVTDNVPQQREPDPADALEAKEEEIEAKLQYLIEDASPEERAKIHSMSLDEKRNLVQAAAEQQAIYDPSPLEDDPHGQPPRKVYQPKQL